LPKELKVEAAEKALAWANGNEGDGTKRESGNNYKTK
jgi:hypothetical protein